MIVVVDSKGNAYPASHILVSNMALVSIGVGRYLLGAMVSSVATVTRNVTSPVTANEIIVTKESTGFSTDGVVTGSSKEGTAIKCAHYVTDRIPTPREKTVTNQTVTKDATCTATATSWVTRWVTPT